MHSDYSVGYRTVEVADNTLALTFPVAVLYPARTPAITIQIGPYPLEVAPDAPIAEGIFPLVIISHGGGSTPWAYRTLAYFLVRHGYVVGLPVHPFNNRNDDAWGGKLENLMARPRHLHLTIDALLAHPELALIPGRVAVIGHSMGGYTALAGAGGQPTCFPWESADGQLHPIAVVPDSRIMALVLLAPATVWFRLEGALRDVQVPVLLLAAEHDEPTPYFHSQIVIDGLPLAGLLEHRVVENANHFSFLSPFPAAMLRPDFLPAQDQPGFDRAQFQEELHAEILTFLARITLHETRASLY
jgi:predicted dienelactone hydrolase